MAGIKVSKKYQSFGIVNPTMQQVDSYKQRMIISPKEERDAHNAAIEAAKKEKRERKFRTN